MMPDAGALQAFVAALTGADGVAVSGLAKMSGGAIQENWAVDLAVERGGVVETIAAVLRTDAPSSLAESHGRAEEFALLGAAFAAGVTVPEPLWLGQGVPGMPRDFFLMRRAAGTADPRRLTRDAGLDGDGLARRLGRELAAIHGIDWRRAGLDFLAAPEGPPALVRVAEFRAALDASAQPQPVVEWGARWLELNAPAVPGALVLNHNDFRTGNYLVEDGAPTAILDWEFAAVGDRHEDLGWFCAKCWRFGRPDREAGGVGAREAFYAGYEEVAGAVIDRGAVAYWEVMAAVRWAVIAIGQGDRYLSGEERSLELALTRHVLPTLEIDILAQTGGGYAR